MYKNTVSSSAKVQKHQLLGKNIPEVRFSNHTVAFLCAIARLIPFIHSPKAGINKFLNSSVEGLSCFPGVTPMVLHDLFLLHQGVQELLAHLRELGVFHARAPQTDKNRNTSVLL